jgi:hypothetical protein
MATDDKATNPNLTQGAATGAAAPANQIDPGRAYCRDMACKCPNSRLASDLKMYTMHKRVSQPVVARANADGPFSMGVPDANSQSFFHPCGPALLNTRLCSMCAQSSFGRTTWPRRALRVGLTTFLQISNVTGLRY